MRRAPPSCANGVPMQTVIDALSGHHIAVIGDVMLDSYLSGDVTRISPEAPVPVVRVTSETAMPGGAANVAANLARLGICVNLVGITGQDSARDELVDLLQNLGGVDCSGLIQVSDRPTTRKLRVVGAHRQLVRVDHEDFSPCSSDTASRLIESAHAAIASADIVIVSDYGKGVCSKDVLRAVLDRAATLGKSVIIDPKKADLTLYRGATILTPNRSELSKATQMPCESDEEAKAAAEFAQAQCGADILLTRSEKGMSLFAIGGEPLHLATSAQDVFDVSGAGDTVVAVLAAALAAGASVNDGMRLANHAAGIVVSKLGTASVTREELAAAFLEDEPAVDDGHGGVVDRACAIKLRMQWGQDKLSVGFTNGCFDLLHPGHVGLIRRAAAACDRLIVALNSDVSVRRLKGPERPIQDEFARAEVMSGIKGVAAVLLFDEDTPREIIETLRPDVLVKGADYTIDEVVGADIVQRHGGRVLLVDIKPGHSTSRLVAAARGTDPH